MPENDQDPAGVLKGLTALPPFPSAALRLLSISTESETAITEYEDTFKSDPALATDLLKVANSVEFGLAARVDNIRQALTLLGLDRVHTVAVTLAMRHYAGEAARPKVLRPLWEHGIASAVIGEALASVRGYSTSGLYTAGLVHDIGRLGLLMAAGNAYATLLARPVASQADAAALETEQLGMTHGEAGEVLAKAWGFPEWLCQVVRYHHQSDTPGEPRLRLAQIACQYASSLGHGEHGDPHGSAAKPLDLPADLRGRPALDPERLRQRINALLFTMGRR